MIENIDLMRYKDSRRLENDLSDLRRMRKFSLKLFSNVIWENTQLKSRETDFCLGFLHG